MLWVLAPLKAVLTHGFALEWCSRLTGSLRAAHAKKLPPELGRVSALSGLPWLCTWMAAGNGA